MVERPVLRFLFFLGSLVIILAGCGGGGGGSTSTTGTTPTGTTVTLSGTAATGTAMADAIINVKDSTGAATEGTADADGKYSIDVTGMTPPFLLRATSGSTTLYSGIDSSGVVNIHPFTDLIIRNWYLAKGTSVDTVFNGTGPLSSPPDATELATMQNVIKSVLDLQLDLFLDSGAFDLFSTAFDADGTGFDALLDKTQVSVSDTAVKIELTDPVSGTVMGDILTLPAGTDISTDTNAVTTAMNAVVSGVSGLQDTINANACTLTGADIQPYFEAGFMYKGWNIDQLATVLKSWLCPDGTTALTLTISVEYISYDDAAGILNARLTFKDSTGHMEQAILKFQEAGGTWVASGDGLPADIKVRSRVEVHMKATGTTFVDKRQVEVVDYSNTITDARVTEPAGTVTTVALVCDDFTTPGSCDTNLPAKVFRFEDTLPLKGTYKVELSTDGGATWSAYEKSIIGIPGADHTVAADFPFFSGISTYSISSVLGTTITAGVYTPAWVSETAAPFVSLWNAGTLLGELDAEWAGIPRAGQYNQFTVTIPATYNGTTVTSAVLGQDAMSEVFEGWGQTNVWWYFE